MAAGASIKAHHCDEARDYVQKAIAHAPEGKKKVLTSLLSQCSADIASEIETQRIEESVRHHYNLPSSTTIQITSLVPPKPALGGVQWETAKVTIRDSATGKSNDFECSITPDQKHLRRVQKIELPTATGTPQADPNVRIREALKSFYNVPDTTSIAIGTWKSKPGWATQIPVKFTNSDGSVKEAIFFYWTTHLTGDVDIELESPPNLTESGVSVVSVVKGSFFDQMGFAPQDVVFQLNQQQISNVEQLRTLFSRLPVGSDVVFLVRKEGDTMFLGGTIPANKSPELLMSGFTLQDWGRP